MPGVDVAASNGARTRGVVRQMMLLMAALSCAVGAAGVAFGQEPGPPVLVATVDGPITPVISDHLADGLDRAEDKGHAAFVVVLDTPGGLDSSMRAIVQRFLGARVPVIVYVSPQGARAGSAGALITLASHVAAMAPGSAIGAATPVGIEGGDVERKVINDAAAFAESIARLRGRNVDVAVDMVRRGRSVPADEALELEAIDVVAASLSEVLVEANGMRVLLGDRMATLRTAEATVEIYEMGLFRRVQQLLADPNLAFLFLSLGTIGLIYELATPGVGVGGVVGVVLILLALFALAVLPVNTVGVLFLVLAAAMFVAELFAPGIGIAAAGGAFALLLSGIFLFDEAPGLEVSLAVVGPVASVTGGAVVVAGRLAVRSRRAPSTTTGKGLFVGREVTVRRADGTRGHVLLEGAWWRVRSDGPVLEPGSVVRVVDIDGLDLVVEPTGRPTRDQRERSAP